MNPEERNTEERHERILELLPWFVTDTLSGQENALVERHVRECLPCYGELQRERRLRSLVRDAPPLPLSSEHGFRRLMSRIDREGTRGSVVGTRHAARRRSRQATLAAGTAASVVVGMVAALFWLDPVWGPGNGGAAYETLTSVEAAVEQRRLHVVFAETSSEAEMRALLRELDARIVAGPTSIGRYTLEMDGRTMTGEELSALADRLMQDERVRFATRVFGTEAE